jgi:hypothetical protein
MCASVLDPGSGSPFLLLMTHKPLPSAEHIAEPLRDMLRAELAAGNQIVELGPSMHASGATMVLLARRFLASPPEPPQGVTFRVINDPHWWYAEYVHAATKDCLACRA